MPSVVSEGEPRVSVVFFGQFLINEGAIDEAQLDAALEATFDRNLPIGQLAIRAGYMSRVAVKITCQAQRSRDLRFGELACELGFLTEEQVERLLHQQTETHLYLGEALVAMGALEQSSLPRWLDRYKLQQAEDFEPMVALPDELREQPMPRTLLEQLPVIYLRAARLQLKTRAGRVWEGESIYEHRVQIECTGSQPIRIGLALSRQFAQKIASSMLECPPEGLEADDIRAAVAEFANWLLGTAKTEVEKHSSGLALGLPVHGELPAHGYAFDLLSTGGNGTLIISL